MDERTTKRAKKIFTHTHAPTHPPTYQNMRVQKCSRRAFKQTNEHCGTFDSYHRRHIVLILSLEKILKNRVGIVSD